MEKVDVSMEVLSAMQLMADMEGLDAQSKLILQNKEVLGYYLQSRNALNCAFRMKVIQV